MGKQAMREKGIELDLKDVQALARKLKAAWVTRQKPENSDRSFMEAATQRLWFKHAARHAPKYCLTVLRHSWCLRALKTGHSGRNEKRP